MDPMALTKAQARRRYIPRSVNFDGTDVSANSSFSDWVIDAPAGYGFHWHLGPNSGAGSAAAAIGTDRGAGDGFLISHSGSGSGYHVDHHPGSGIGVYVVGMAINPALWLDVYAGSGGQKIVLKSGQAFADGVSVSGSRILTSVTAAFVAGDVGQAIGQTKSRDSSDPQGCVPTGATITAVYSPTTATAWASTAGKSLGDVGRPSTANGHLYRVTTAGTTAASEPTWPTTTGNTVTDGTVVWTDLGTAATAAQMSSAALFTSVGGVIFRVGGRVPSTGLAMLTGVDTDGTTTLFQFRRASATIATALTVNPVTGDTTRVPLAVKASASGTIDAFQVQESGGTAHVRVTQPTASKAASLVVGKAALATTATDGFLYIPTVAGTPTGTPTTQAGTAAIVWDTVGHRLWTYEGGAWR